MTGGTLSTWNCGNFVNGRTMSDNENTYVNCSGNKSAPAKRNGGYCFYASAGDHPYAFFGSW